MKIKSIGIVLVLAVAGLWAAWNGGLVVAAGNVAPALFKGSVSAVEPLSGGMVFVTDSSTPARKFTAPISANGTYVLNAARGVAPFLFNARGHEGARKVELFSASSAQSGTVNISPLTSLVVASVAGQDCVVADCSPSIFTQENLTSATVEVQSQLVPLLVQFGLAIADELDPRENDQKITRKWLYFKHIAVGGFIFARDGPFEFIKDDRTGNWRQADRQRLQGGARAGKNAKAYAPLPGASSFGKWLHFASESPSYPDGATLISVSSTSIIPPVTLLYMGMDGGFAKMNGDEMVGAISGKSFLPACPHAAMSASPCIKVEQVSNGGVYTAVIKNLVDSAGMQASMGAN